MNELAIFLALIPLIVFGFGGPKRLFDSGVWVSVAVAAVCVGYFLWLESNDVLRWGAVPVLAAIWISDITQRRKTNPYSLLSFFFVCQGLLAQSLGTAIICVAFADLFTNVEAYLSKELSEKNRAIHNIFRSLITFAPAAIGILLHLQGSLLTGMIVITILLRLFSWPLGDTKYQNLIIGAGSAIALWHIVDFSQQPEWALVWLGLATLLSLGAKYSELYISMCLGLYCISPTLGLLSICALPLLVHEGVGIFITPLLTCCAGVIISDFSTKFLYENVIFGIAPIGGFAIARAFVSLRFKHRQWYMEALDLVLVAILVGIVIYLGSVPEVSATPNGLIFGGVFLISYLLGKVVFSKKPKFFRPINNFSASFISEGWKTPEVLKEGPGRQISIVDRPLIIKFYRVIENESHLVWLIGLLGLALFWGLK